MGARWSRQIESVWSTRSVGAGFTGRVQSDMMLQILVEREMWQIGLEVSESYCPILLGFRGGSVNDQADGQMV